MDERLSERELRVVELVAEGFTNAQIGTRLGLTEHIVKHALIALFKRLNLRDRAHAVAWAFNNGYLLPSRPVRWRGLRPTRELQPHGTRAAVARHRYHKEKLCAVCRNAERERERERARQRRKKPPIPVGNPTLEVAS